MAKQEWITKKEIAQRYDVPDSTVNLWVGQAGWPAKGAKRGLYDTYNAAAVEATLNARRDLEAVARLRALGQQLVTARQVAEIFGLAPATLRGYAHRGQLGEGVERDGVAHYRADVVADFMEQRRPRRRG
jgi:hypothetical protein